MIAQHLALLFDGTEGLVPVRILPEKGGPKFTKRLPFETSAGDLSGRAVAHATTAAGLGGACYVFPGTVRKAGSATAKDVWQMACLLADLDSGDIGSARKHLSDWLGPATMTVASCGVTQEGRTG